MYPPHLYIYQTTHSQLASPKQQHPCTHHISIYTRLLTPSWPPQSSSTRVPTISLYIPDYSLPAGLPKAVATVYPPHLYIYQTTHSQLASPKQQPPRTHHISVSSPLFLQCSCCLVLVECKGSISNFQVLLSSLLHRFLLPNRCASTGVIEIHTYMFYYHFPEGLSRGNYILTFRASTHMFTHINLKPLITMEPLSTDTCLLRTLLLARAKCSLNTSIIRTHSNTVSLV